MSFTAIFYSCTRCDFSCGGSNAIYEYQGVPKREPWARIVWCKECDAITNGVFSYLDFHTNPNMEESIDYINFLKSSFFYRFSAKKKKEVAKLEEIIKTEKTAMEARISYFKENSFQGKCLSCGSLQITRLKPFSNYLNHYFSISGEPPEPTGVTHSCGGEILVATGAHFYCGSNYKPLIITYNEHGKVIKDD